MSATGPSFISLQATDFERTAAFYERYLGLTRQPGPPHAIVFATEPIAFAIRRPEEGVDPAATAPWAGAGLALWLHASDVQAIHDRMAADGITVVTPPYSGPFGLTFTFADPDGYRITLHDRVP